MAAPDDASALQACLQGLVDAANAPQLLHRVLALPGLWPVAGKALPPAELVPIALKALVRTAQLVATERSMSPALVATLPGITRLLWLVGNLALVAESAADEQLCHASLLRPRVQGLISMAGTSTVEQLILCLEDLTGAKDPDGLMARAARALAQAISLLQVAASLPRGVTDRCTSKLLLQPDKLWMAAAQLCAAVRTIPSANTSRRHRSSSSGGSSSCDSSHCSSQQAWQDALAHQVEALAILLPAVAGRVANATVAAGGLALPACLRAADDGGETLSWIKARADLIMVHLALLVAAHAASFDGRQQQQQQQQQEQLQLQRWRAALPAYHEQLLTSNASWAGLREGLLAGYQYFVAQNEPRDVTVEASLALMLLLPAVPAPQRMPLVRLAMGVAACAGSLEQQCGRIWAATGSLRGAAAVDSQDGGVTNVLLAVEAAGLLHPVLHVLAPSVLLTLQRQKREAAAAAAAAAQRAPASSSSSSSSQGQPQGQQARQQGAAGQQGKQQDEAKWVVKLVTVLSQVVVWVASAVQPKHLAATMAQQPLVCCAALEMAVRAYGAGLLKAQDLPACCVGAAQEDVLSPSRFAAHVAAACRVACEEGLLASHLGGAAAAAGSTAATAAAAAAASTGAAAASGPGQLAAEQLLPASLPPAQALQAQLYSLLVSCLKAPAGPGSQLEQDVQAAECGMEVLWAAHAAQQACAASPAAGSDTDASSATSPSAAEAAESAALSPHAQPVPAGMAVHVATAAVTVAAKEAAADQDSSSGGRGPDALHWAALLARCTVAIARCPAAVLGVGRQLLASQAGAAFMAAAERRCQSDVRLDEALNVCAVVSMFGTGLSACQPHDKLQGPLVRWWAMRPQASADSAALDAFFAAAPELEAGSSVALAQSICEHLVAAGLPLSLVCCNASCANLAGASELHLVAGGPGPGGVCGGCRLARFCSRACQSEAWPAHKAACTRSVCLHIPPKTLT